MFNFAGSSLTSRNKLRKDKARQRNAAKSILEERVIRNQMRDYHRRLLPTDDRGEPAFAEPSHLYPPPEGTEHPRTESNIKSPHTPYRESRGSCDERSSDRKRGVRSEKVCGGSRCKKPSPINREHSRSVAMPTTTEQSPTRSSLPGTDWPKRHPTGYFKSRW